jgi:predicted nuclease of predicted toxin-antitoxin system
MKFVADESVDAPIVYKLRENGHHIFSIAEELAGINDESVIRIALEKNCILITQDKDFGELVFKLNKAHEGVILLRLTGLSPLVKAELTFKVILQHRHKLLGAVTVVYQDFVKIRHP